MSSSNASADRPKGGEAVLVETAATDPIAALEAASGKLDGGPLLAVLGTVPKQSLERQLAGLGADPDESLVVDFPSWTRPEEGSDEGESEPGHGDIAGLSMELIGRFDGLADQGGVVYIDALEQLVELAGFESAFRFLVIVAARARAAGVPLVVRVDPDAVDQWMARTLAEAFDRFVEVPVDGSSVDC